MPPRKYVSVEVALTADLNARVADLTADLKVSNARVADLTAALAASDARVADLTAALVSTKAPIVPVPPLPLAITPPRKVSGVATCMTCNHIGAVQTEVYVNKINEAWCVDRVKCKERQEVALSLHPCYFANDYCKSPPGMAKRYSNTKHIVCHPQCRC